MIKVSTNPDNTVSLCDNCEWDGCHHKLDKSVVTFCDDYSPVDTKYFEKALEYVGPVTASSPPSFMTQVSDHEVKDDSSKPKLHLVPSKIIWAIAAVREYGNKKYPEGGENNWKQVKDPMRYWDALLRHVEEARNDPYAIDEESGLPHLWQICCNGAFLCDIMDEILQKTREDV